MISLINLAVLFAAKVADNALSTTKTILVQRSRWILAGIAVIISDFIYFWITKRVVSANNEIAMLAGYIMSLKLNENNLNEFGRYDELKKTVDKAKAKEYFEKVEGTKIIPPKVNVKVDKLLRDFIISGGYEIQMPTEDE